MSTRTDAGPQRAIVIGLGNPLMADDGLGIAAIERLQERYRLPDEVELVDGGTWGMNLLPAIEGAQRVLLVDAIDAGAAPGTVLVVRGDELPRYFATKVSVHQIDLRDVLALAELRGTLPAEIVAIGLQPQVVDLVRQLSSAVELALPALVERVATELARWGHGCQRQPAAALREDVPSLPSCAYR